MVNVLTHSEVGGHRLNQDACVVRQHPHADDVWLAFVADGQGGRAGGAEASGLACRTALEGACATPPKRLAEPRTWLELVARADEAVAADATAGFTTLVGLCVGPRGIVGASNGDSAALLLSGEQTVELTRQQIKNPPVGSGTAVVPFAATPRPPWRLLMMTDGVWKYVGWERVVRVARQNDAAGVIRELLSAARLPRTGQLQDDFTIAVIDSASNG